MTSGVFFLFRPAPLVFVFGGGGVGRVEYFLGMYGYAFRNSGLPCYGWDILRRDFFSQDISLPHIAIEEEEEAFIFFVHHINLPSGKDQRTVKQVLR